MRFPQLAPLCSGQTNVAFTRNYCPSGVALRAAANCQSANCIYQGNQVRHGSSPVQHTPANMPDEWRQEIILAAQGFAGVCHSLRSFPSAPSPSCPDARCSSVLSPCRPCAAADPGERHQWLRGQRHHRCRWLLLWLQALACLGRQPGEPAPAKLKQPGNNEGCSTEVPHSTCPHAPPSTSCLPPPPVQFNLGAVNPCKGNSQYAMLYASPQTETQREIFK